MRNRHSSPHNTMTITCIVDVLSEKVLEAKTMQRIIKATEPLESLGALITFNFRRPDMAEPMKVRQARRPASRRKARAAG